MCSFKNCTTTASYGQYFNIHWGYECATKPITVLFRAEYKSKEKHYWLVWCSYNVLVPSIKFFLGAQSLGIVKGLQSTEKDYNLKNITSRHRLKVLWGVVIHSSLSAHVQFQKWLWKLLGQNWTSQTACKLWLCCKLIHSLVPRPPFNTARGKGVWWI